MPNVVFRLANEADLPAVLEMSEDIYGGHDYFVSEFLKFLNNPNRKILIAEMDGKTVGLRVMHIVDEGETVIGHSLRVHFQHRCQGIGRQLIQECRNYVKDNFPQVKFERYLTGNAARLAIQKKSDDVKFHEAVAFARLVKSNASELNSRLASYSTHQTTDLKQLNKTELERILNHSQDQLRKILFKGKYIGVRQPFKALASNITNGLFEDDDAMFVSYSGESLLSLSHSRWYPVAERPRLNIVCYTLDKELLKFHLVKQLEYSITQHLGETFIFAPMIDTSLVESTNDFLSKDLSLKTLRDGAKAYHNLYFYEKSFV
ncbi:histidine N-acetyltransferase-like [Dendronephthya gigantea]|uniref:histidine N-acetyltransferase-like n=1 Tax=Dendronephthya gigantea TaxID=151771 RepID=UPI00106DCBE1|nr:histidine N-acetyltransferase-like [Dendronephthya gigantea]